MQRPTEPEYPFSSTLFAHVRPAAFKDNIIVDDLMRMTKLETSHLRQYADQLRKLSIFDRSACLYALETTSAISLRYFIGIGGIPLYEDGLRMFKKITEKAQQKLGPRDFERCKSKRWEGANIGAQLEEAALLLNKCMVKNEALCRAYIHFLFPNNSEIIEAKPKNVSEKKIQSAICHLSQHLSLFDSLYLIKELESSIIYDIQSKELQPKWVPQNCELSEETMVGIIMLDSRLSRLSPPRYRKRIFNNNLDLIQEVRQRLSLQLMDTNLDERYLIKVRLEMETIASKRTIEMDWLRPREMDEAPGEKRADSCCWCFCKKKMPEKCASLFYNYNNKSSNETIERLSDLFKREE